MARKPDDASRMQHMAEFARKATLYTQGKSRDDLDHDEVLCLALVRLIEMIGGAAARVTAETRRNRPDIP